MNPNAPLVIKKIEKRLLELIRCWQVQEIRLEDGKIEPGKARVLKPERVQAAKYPPVLLLKFAGRGINAAINSFVRRM